MRRTIARQEERHGAAVPTFSIVAFDPVAADIEVAVASKFLAAGAVAPWARAGAGAVATQSYANANFGPRGLTIMRDGASAEQEARQIQSRIGQMQSSMTMASQAQHIHHIFDRFSAP